jgi:outer membrane protein assembly factor BamA
VESPDVRRRVTSLEAEGSLEPVRGRVSAYLAARAFLRVAPGEGLRAENLFPVGGSRSVRGYEERRFRTARGGVITLEARRYLGLEAARVFVFVDAGFLDRARSIGTDGDPWKIGTGAGMRVESRLGLVGVDVAASEDLGSYDEIRLHFSIEGRY